MEPQEIIIREFFSKLKRLSPKELSPRSGEKYRFSWKGDNGRSYCEMFQMGDCLYLTADTETSADNDEFQMLQLLNELNGWSHYGIFTFNPKNKLVLYEQTHFCRYFEYTLPEIHDFYHQMVKRMGMYYLSANSVFRGTETDIEKAVDLAKNVIETIHTQEIN